MIWLLIILTIPIVLGEGLPLIRHKRWKDLIAVSVLIGIALLIGFGKMIGIPTPIELMDDLLHPIGETIFKHL